MLALLGLGTALSIGPAPRTPRARLKIVARGFAPLDNLERHVLEYTRVLGSLLQERCGAEDGCLVVDVQWQAPRYPNDAAMQMRLEIRGEPEEPDSD